MLKRFFLLLTLTAYLHAEGEFLTIDPQSDGMGFFAVSNLVLGHLALYDSGHYKISGLEVNFGRRGVYYEPKHGPNWWHYYFEPLVIGSKENSTVRTTTHGEDDFARDKRSSLSRHEAHQLINQYIKVKSHILNRVDHFAKKHFKNHFIIGIHYRGTDKVRSKAPRVSYQKVFKIIRKKIAQHGSDDWRLFVATDEAEFLAKIKKAFPKRVIATKAIRSNNGEPVHKSRINPYQAGEDALIDALLLSKTNLLIRTSSNLSIWSSYLNPDLPVKILSYKYEGLE